MSVVMHNGIQVLPSVGDDRATASEWVVIQACSADNRRKFPLLEDQARRFTVVAA